ncbi:MAG TPA: hypothetical protein ENK65_02235, partial [Helicobacteraceae bacterium]|nr:hypothetical protein [Helicobacteraceae bacterium]
MKLTHKIAALALSSMTLISPSLLAQEVDVTITNLTKGMLFTPLLVAAHPSNEALFTSGGTASLALQKMAEGGDTSDLTTDLTATNAVISNNPASGLLAPGASTTTTLNIDDASNSNLSIVAMMLPTNDGFIALNNAPIPTEEGTYTYKVNAYDAGTEANDEIINGGGAPNTPGIPGGASNTGATGVAGVSAEGYIHIHRGSLGDFEANGGISDLD